jgi:hypothetical protein
MRRLPRLLTIIKRAHGNNWTRLLIIRFHGAGLGGLWIAFIGWFLLEVAGATYLQVRAGGPLRGLLVKDVMSSECAKIDRGTSVEEFAHDQLRRTGRGDLPHAA